jgi:uncharacterized membrane protein YccC
LAVTSDDSSLNSVLARRQEGRPGRSRRPLRWLLLRVQLQQPRYSRREGLRALRERLENGELPRALLNFGSERCRE